MRGKLIVIDGTDGSGKHTQSELLYKTLQAEGKPVRMISFPDYKSEFAIPVSRYLDGAFGKDPKAVNAYAASSFFAVDRYASYKLDWGKFYEDGGIIIADRYTTSNAIHQCSKLPREEWDGFIEWLFEFEYKRMGIPAPDQVIYLRVDTMAVTQKNMSNRYGEDESRKDIHESDVGYQEDSRDAARYCAEKLGWTTIWCTEGNTMRTVEAIHRDVMAALKE